jgi:hypothetical protein
MLKIPAEYDGDTTSAKFKEIYLKLPASILYVSAATRRHWSDWNTDVDTVCQKMHGRDAVNWRLCMIPPGSSTQQPVTEVSQLISSFRMSRLLF